MESSLRKITFSLIRLVITSLVFSAGSFLLIVLFVYSEVMLPDITPRCDNCGCAEEVTYCTCIPCLCFIKICLVCCVTMMNCCVCHEIVSTIDVVLDETERM